MRVFIGLVNAISQSVGFIAATMIVVAVAITCQMIFIRYFLNGSTYWQTEAVIYLMVAATLLGLPYVQKLKGHVNVELVPMLLPPIARKLLITLTFGVAIGILLVMTYYSGDLVHTAYSKNWKSETVWGPPVWIPYLAMPIGFGLFALQLFADLLDTIATRAEDIVIEAVGH